MKKLVKMICPFCKDKHSVEVDVLEYENWMNRELIQQAMPTMSVTKREQLITSMCPKCQI